MHVRERTSHTLAHSKPSINMFEQLLAKDMQSFFHPIKHYFSNVKKKKSDVSKRNSRGNSLFGLYIHLVTRIPSQITLSSSVSQRGNERLCPTRTLKYNKAGRIEQSENHSEAVCAPFCPVNFFLSTSSCMRKRKKKKVNTETDC